MTRGTIVVLALVLLAVDAGAQSRELKAYLNSDVALTEAAAIAKKDPSMRTLAEIQGLLPHRVSQRYVNFVQVTRVRSLLDVVDSLRLNKMLAGPPGTGGTSLVSRVAVPAVLGAAIEYGGILQQTTGPVTTLRGNALGVGRLVFGSEQFPYCPEIDRRGCGTTSRRLRAISGTVSLEDTRRPEPGTTPGVPAAVDLLGSDFRTASWGVRVDITPSNNLDDPRYVAAWGTAIDRLRKDSSSAVFSRAVVDFFSNALMNETYTEWMSETVALLMKAPEESQFYQTLEDRLTLLTTQLAATDPQFATNVTALSRAFLNYAEVRDALIREAHVHKFSAEVTNVLPLNVPSTWNARLVYSHQPTSAPTLVTANVSATWFAEEGPQGERWRDIQLAGQLDRRLSEIPRLGYAVATFALYYQWLKDDALIKAPAGPVAPGTGIVLSDNAATLLGTKGHIVVIQGQFSIPVGETVKVPFSVTWSNRSELIKEKDMRGQVGLTLDLDGLFH